MVKNALDWIALVLLIIGGLNWGLIGIGGIEWNVVHIIFGTVEWLERLVYILVGLSALWVIYFAIREE
jgi:uncharacterized protein